MNNDKPAVALPDFGDYVTIEQKRFGAPNEFWDYKVIGRLVSNTWTDVPVSPEREVRHDACEPIILAVADNLIQEDVRRFRVSDVKLRAKPEALPAAPAVMEALFPETATFQVMGHTDEGDHLLDVACEGPGCGPLPEGTILVRLSDVERILTATQPAVAVEAGWKLVPIKPTSEMRANGSLSVYQASHSEIDLSDDEMAAGWAGMLHATPSAPGAAPIPPVATAQPEAGKPALTDEQISAGHWNRFFSDDRKHLGMFRAGVRFAEQAHGIGNGGSA